MSKSGGEALHALARWYQTPAGMAVADIEARVLERLLRDSFGHYLVQLGAPGVFGAAFRAGRIRRRVAITEQASEASLADHADVLIQARPEALPLANASVDTLVLPHTLDFCAQPLQVLREVERVLIADGRVILIGFNPLSPWGLWRVSPLARRQGLPGAGSHLTAGRVSDWLRLLGFELEAHERAAFRLPPGQRPAGPIARLGSGYLPLPGGIYLVRAVKRVPPLTPVGLPWWRTPRLFPGRAVEPSARVSGENSRLG